MTSQPKDGVKTAEACLTSGAVVTVPTDALECVLFCAAPGFSWLKKFGRKCLREELLSKFEESVQAERSVPELLCGKVPQKSHRCRWRAPHHRWKPSCRTQGKHHTLGTSCTGNLSPCVFEMDMFVFVLDEEIM